MDPKPKPWVIEKQYFDTIKEMIKSYGAEEIPPTNQYEVWRLKVGDSLFILYTSGKLYNNKATSMEVLELRDKITNVTGSGFTKTGREILVGLDETGKGEVIGHVYLCGASFPANLSKEIEDIIGTANTKSRRTFEYWDSLFSQLDDLQGSGLEFIIQIIPPWHVDKYNLNKLLDMKYRTIISDVQE